METRLFGQHLLSRPTAFLALHFILIEFSSPSSIGTKGKATTTPNEQQHKPGPGVILILRLDDAKVFLSELSEASRPLTDQTLAPGEAAGAKDRVWCRVQTKGVTLRGRYFLIFRCLRVVEGATLIFFFLSDFCKAILLLSPSASRHPLHHMCGWAMHNAHIRHAQSSAHGNCSRQCCSRNRSKTYSSATLSDMRQVQSMQW